MTIRLLPYAVAWMPGRKRIFRPRKRKDDVEAWDLNCPYCGTENEIMKQVIIVKCGVAYCHCTCVNCQQEFDSQQDYSIWLGLSESSLVDFEDDMPLIEN